MPTPSQQFRREYEQLGNATELSVITLYKRFLRAKKHNEQLTYAQFFRGPQNLQAERKRVSLFIKDKGEMSFIDVCRELTAFSELSVPGVRLRLNAYLDQDPDVRTFDSIKALWRVLDSREDFGQANPIQVDGRHFHNLKYLLDEYAGHIEIEGRTLAQRVADLKSLRGLKREEVLYLTKPEFAELIARNDPRLSYSDFKALLSEYIKKHDLVLVRSDVDQEAITAKQAYAMYENNRTPFYFRCRRCISTGLPAKPFSKSLDHWNRQGCPVCSRERCAEDRKLSANEVRRRIAAHPAGIDWLDDDTYRGKASPLTVTCRKCGQGITRVAQEFFEYGSFLECPHCGVGRIGESLTVGVVNFLLNTGRPAGDMRELTPPHLRAWPSKSPLRHDGYFELLDPAIKLAVEHMGAQHVDPNHNYHIMSQKGKEESFRELQERDEWKRNACHKADGGGVALVEVPDLVASCKTMLEAAQLVVQKLIETVGSLLFSIPGFRQRIEQLNQTLVYRLLSTSERLPLEDRLQAQLDEEKSTVEIQSYDPISRFFTLSCKTHPGHSWPCYANNAIRSKISGRGGTRCKHCAIESHAAKCRLTIEEVDAKAAEAGFRRAFDHEIYKSNAGRLTWECLKDPNHVVHDSLTHLLERGCSHCRTETRRRRRQRDEHAKLDAIVATRGDLLISSKEDYRNNRSKMLIRCLRPGGCGQTYTMAAGKIKAGQMCACDKNSRIAQSRRARNATTACSALATEQREEDEPAS